MRVKLFSLLSINSLLLRFPRDYGELTEKVASAVDPIIYDPRVRFRPFRAEQAAGRGSGRIYLNVVFYLQEQHDHIIEISRASGTVELRAAAVLLVVLAGSVALRLDDGVEPFRRAPRGMIIARALALGGLVGIDVDRPIVHLDLHHGVHRVLAVTLVAGAGSAGARHDSGLPLAARADLAVGRALVALAAEADQIAVAGEVAVLTMHDDVAVTSAELADRAFAVCEQIGGLARSKIVA